MHAMTEICKFCFIIVIIIIIIIIIIKKQIIADILRVIRKFIHKIYFLYVSVLINKYYCY